MTMKKGLTMTMKKGLTMTMKEVGEKLHDLELNTTKGN
jgi:hypothetical protein